MLVSSSFPLAHSSHFPLCLLHTHIHLLIPFPRPMLPGVKHETAQQGTLEIKLYIKSSTSFGFQVFHVFSVLFSFTFFLLVHSTSYYRALSLSFPLYFPTVQSCALAPNITNFTHIVTFCHSNKVQSRSSRLNSLLSGLPQNSSVHVVNNIRFIRIHRV